MCSNLKYILQKENHERLIFKLSRINLPKEFARVCDICYNSCRDDYAMRGNSLKYAYLHKQNSHAGFAKFTVKSFTHTPWIIK